MIFQHTWQQVLDGSKRQTRRILKSGDMAWVDKRNKISLVDGVTASKTAFKRWEVGKTYAVQPARTHAALLYCPDHPCYGIDIIEPNDSHYQHAKEGTWNWEGQGYKRAEIKITGIRRERVQDITPDDARAEMGSGDNNPLHDEYMANNISDLDVEIGEEWPCYVYRWIWNRIHTKKGERWADNPEVWVLEFELVD